MLMSEDELPPSAYELQIATEEYGRESILSYSEKDAGLDRDVPVLGSEPLYSVDWMAVLAHRLWTHWSQHIAEEEDISEERLNRWQELWVPFNELSSEMKEKDEELVERFLKEKPDYEVGSSDSE
jgi:hypothetical protein